MVDWIVRSVVVSVLSFFLTGCILSDYDRANREAHDSEVVEALSEISGSLRDYEVTAVIPGAAVVGTGPDKGVICGEGSFREEENGPWAVRRLSIERAVTAPEEATFSTGRVWLLRRRGLDGTSDDVAIEGSTPLLVWEGGAIPVGAETEAEMVVLYRPDLPSEFRGFAVNQSADRRLVFSEVLRHHRIR